MNKRGFTIIELLVVFGLVLFLATFAIPYSLDYYRDRAINEQARSITSVLRRAQFYASSGRDGASWGVSFSEEDNIYYLFKGWDCDQDVYQEFNLSSGVDISGVDCVVFESQSGKTHIVNND